MKASSTICKRTHGGLRKAIAAAVAGTSVAASSQAAGVGAGLANALRAIHVNLPPANQDQSPDSRVPTSPLISPPFPDSDWLGFPLIGQPYSTGASDYPLQHAIFDHKLDKSGVLVYGWLNPSYNRSTSRNSNAPLSYNLVPNRLELDQAILVAERWPDTVQTKRQDWGFRSVTLYGTDYRYTIMKGVFSNQLLKFNHLYGADPVEFYGIAYYPHVGQGMVVRFGRYISPPDIEAQLTPDNYLFTHSLMFSVDPYTFMGVNATVRLNSQWQLMAQAHGGNDMAVWSDSASLNFGLMARWVSKDNRDGVWGGINSIGKGRVRDEHDNLQQIVATWGHKFDSKYHMMTEAYTMWEYGAPLGGTAIDGPTRPFFPGGGAGPTIPGKSVATGAVNYFEIYLGKKDYATIRSDFLGDKQGFRTGYKTNYFSETLGWTHYFAPSVEFRPEIRYEHAFDAPAYDNGLKRDQWTVSADLIFRF